MMREILFRGKRSDNGEWVEGLFVCDRKVYGRKGYHAYIVDHPHPSVCFGRDIYREVDPETVGQYTGLTDKNGNRIFEGDIIWHKNENPFSVPWFKEKGVVFWDDSYCGWKRTSDEVFHNGVMRTYCLSPDCVYKVIGNIHDDSELLEGEEAK